MASTPANFRFMLKGLAVDISELMEVEAKLREMRSNVGVSLTDREIAILQNGLRTSVEVCDYSGDNRVVPGSVAGSENIGKRNANLVLATVRNGFCYMRLLTSLPSLNTANPLRVMEVVLRMNEELGVAPEGLSVFTCLTMAENMLSESSGPIDFTGATLEEGNLPTHTGIANRLLESPVRYSYKEEGGLFHVDLVHMCDDDTNILCEHNFWAARFILSIITRPGTRVGADIDLSALFVRQEGKAQSVLSHISEGTELETTFRPPPRRTYPAPQTPPMRAQISSEANDLPQQMPTSHQDLTLDDSLDQAFAGVLDSHLEERTAMLDKALQELTEETAKAKALNETLRRSTELGIKGSAEAVEVASTIMPNDSSSVIERYQRHFIDKASYNMRANRTELEPLSQRSCQPEYKDVVCGFLKTASMVVKEEEQKDRVYMINGLAAPFKDSRLNFLCHFHTALQECSFDPKLDPIDALQEIGESRPLNPTGELMRQVIQRTFDFTDMVVVANPFRIPFIEVGMNLTDTVVMKSLDLTLAEYKTTWFQEIKCLKMPPFHDEYASYTTTVRESMRQGAHRRRRSSSRSVRSQSARAEADTVSTGTRRHTSILGFRT